jgi:hypothetical protein
VAWLTATASVTQATSIHGAIRIGTLRSRWTATTYSTALYTAKSARMPEANPRRSGCSLGSVTKIASAATATANRSAEVSRSFWSGTAAIGRDASTLAAGAPTPPRRAPRAHRTVRRAG